MNLKLIWDSNKKFILALILCVLYFSYLIIDYNNYVIDYLEEHGFLSIINNVSYVYNFTSSNSSFNLSKVVLND